MDVTFKGKVRIKIELEPAEVHPFLEIFRYMGWASCGSFDSVHKMAKDLFNEASRQAKDAGIKRSST